MPDANEEIVRRYLEVDGYFVQSRVRYKYTTPNGGSGWSDIDLCGIDPNGRAIAVEVKGWHTEKITAGYIKDWPGLFHFAERAEAKSTLTALLQTDEYRKVLVVGDLGPVGGKDFSAYAESLGVEILTFRQILEHMIATTPLGPDAATDGEHMIRLLKVYDFLPVESGTSNAH